jgi:hypothetical protein
MPEIPEQNTFRTKIHRFIASPSYQPGALKVTGLYADVKESELEQMARDEKRLLVYASTLSVSMLEIGFHFTWVIRLGRIAESIPDTHGLACTFDSSFDAAHKLI